MSDFYENLQNFNTPYIVAEIGANHNGDMILAKKIINSAKACGCDCVKFQSWTPESIIAREEYDRNQKYYDSPKKHFGSLMEMVEKYYLNEKQHRELKEYCNQLKIDFASSPFSNAEIDLLTHLDVRFIKVASMDINNLPLIAHIAQRGKPILLSTGMASLAEVENAVKTIEGEGNNNIVLLHCISIYPPEYHDIHLNNIPMLKQAFGFPVGFSDHSIGFSIPLASVVLGSCLIEKHFTLDKNLPGWDHEISANPEEMRIIVEESKHIIQALGSSRRTVSRAEEEKKLKFRRSLVTVKDIKQGHCIINDDITAKRPGTGIPPNEYGYVIGRTLKRDIQKDELLHWEDFTN